MSEQQGSSSVWELPAEFLAKYRRPVYMEPAFVKAIGRIQEILAETTADIALEVTDQSDPEHISVQATLNAIPIGRTFVSRVECRRAFEGDSDAIRAIDALARTWAALLQRQVARPNFFKRMMGRFGH